MMISKADQAKTRQKEYHDKAYFNRKEKKRSLIGDFIEYFPLIKAISLFPYGLRGKLVIDICCGDGFEAEYLYKLGARLTVLDISSRAVRRALKRVPKARGVVGDAEKLPFSDDEFDISLVVAGLHHLPHPYRGIKELSRVGRCGFIFIEAQRNFITRLLLKFGFAQEYEESGNFVYRFSRNEIKKIMKELGIEKYIARTYWCRYISFLNEKIYPHFDNKIWLNVFKLIFYAFNKIFGYWGNCLIVVAVKK